MKQINSLYLSLFTLFSSPIIISLSLSITSSTYSQQNASEKQNTNSSYIYLKKHHSNIANIISEIGALDHNPNSPINRLMLHIEKGANAITRNEMIYTLEYACS